MTTIQDTFIALEDAAIRSDMCPSFPAPQRTIDALHRVAPARAARFELANQLEAFRKRLEIEDK